MTTERRPARLGIVGLGRIGARLLERLPGTPDAPEIVALLVRPKQRKAAAERYPSLTVVDTLQAFVVCRPNIAVECAGAAVLAQMGPRLLAAGIDVMPLSLAALANRATEARLLAAARTGPGRLEIPAGAMGSVDFLAAAREDRLDAVTFRAVYPSAQWRGTAAEAMTDLDSPAPKAFFRGSVREAVTLFPSNINVAVGVALAGLGLDATVAELVADPTLTQATFTVEAAAGPGPVTLTVTGRDAALGADPADYTTFSLMHLLRRRQAAVRI